MTGREEIQDLIAELNPNMAARILALYDEATKPRFITEQVRRVAEYAAVAAEGTVCDHRDAPTTTIFGVSGVIENAAKDLLRRCQTPLDEIEATQPWADEAELAEAMLDEWCGSKNDANDTLRHWQREHNWTRWRNAARVALSRPVKP